MKTLDPFTPEDFPAIEAKMREIIARNRPFTKEVWEREEAKQVFRRTESGTMAGDLIAAVDEEHEGDPLLVPAMRDGEPAGNESLDEIRTRAAAQLAQLPEPLRRQRPGAKPEPYPVEYSKRLQATVSA